MRAAVTALSRAAGNLFDRRIIALVFLPMLGSLVVWVVLAWLFWDTWTGGITAAMGSTKVAGWLQGWSANWVIDYTAALVVSGDSPPCHFFQWSPGDASSWG